ncbi:MAG: hypothetical protein FJZ58_06260 [Chlamydiae bacterium]|nr:hypothetical protein [Chlamydiota bacterium]
MQAVVLAVIPVLEGARMLWDAYAPPPTTLCLVVLVVAVIGVVAAFFVQNPLALLGFSLLTVFSCYCFWQLYCAETITVLTGKVDGLQGVFATWTQHQESIKADIASLHELTGRVREVKEEYIRVLAQMKEISPIEVSSLPRQDVLEEILLKLEKLNTYTKEKVTQVTNSPPSAPPLGGPTFFRGLFT